MRKRFTLPSLLRNFFALAFLTTFTLLLMPGTASAQCLTSTGPTNDCSYGDAVDSVSIGTQTVSNFGCSGTGSGYNFFSAPIFNLTLGASYPLYVECGGGQYDQGISIWIDLNDDGQFASTEQVFVTASWALTHSGTLTMPATGSAGDTVRMRIMASYYTVPAPGDACASNLGSYGETEDYDVVLSAAAPAGDAAVIGFTSPQDSICSTGSDTIEVVVTNAGGDTLNGISVDVMFGGDFSGGLTSTVTSLPPGDTNTVTFITTAFAGGGNLMLTGWTTHPTDTINNANDTLMQSLTIFKTLSIMGADTICPGDSVSLMADTGSGIGYAWFDMMMGGTPISTSNPYMTGPIAQTDTFWLEGTGFGCPNRIWHEVYTRYTPMMATSTQDTVCSGLPVTLSVPPAAGQTHEWFTVPTGGTAFATGDMATTAPVTTTTTFYVGATNGCTQRASITITAVSDAPMVMAMSDTICEGATATVWVTNDMGDYDWYDAATGGTLLGSGDTLTTAVLSGPTTIYAELNGAYCPGRTPITISTQSAPSAVSFTSVPTGLNVAFTSSVTGAGSYSWDFGDGVGTSTQQNPSYTYASTGTYSVTLTVTNSCGSDSATNQVDIIVGLKESLSNAGIDVFPNPTQGKLSLDFVNFSGEDVNISVISLQGQKVYNKSFDQVTPGQTLELNLDNVAAGSYMLMLSTEGRVYSQKLIKE